MVRKDIITPLNRTFSLLDKQMGELREGAQKYMSRMDSNNQHPSRKLSKIEEFTPREVKQHHKNTKKHKSNNNKSKRNHSIKSNLDLWEIRQEKAPELPSLQPIEHSMMTRNNFHANKNSRKNINDDHKKEFSVKEDRTVFHDRHQYQLDGEMLGMGNKTLYKPKSQFRTNMFYR